MKQNIKRRNFLKSLVAAPALTTPAILLNSLNASATPIIEKFEGSKLKLSLNAYSFNEPLRNGTMNLEDLLNFCADHNFDAVDLTGYYFPGYPAVPADEYIFSIKQTAFKLGLDISGTGIKNDFAQADAQKRKEDVVLVKKWIDVAAKLGAPVIRVFSGLRIPAGYAWEQTAEWMISDLKECAAYGEKRGVMVAMQNHNDFIKTADDAQKIIEGVNSNWFGLVLDIGSYRGNNPYQEIEQTAKFALNWQLKETMYFNNIERKTDVKKIIDIIKSSGYRGYVPIETLGAGDPRKKVPVFLSEVRQALGLDTM